MLPTYALWLVSGGPWLVWHDADIGFALTAIAYMGLGPTMLGNLFYLMGSPWLPGPRGGVPLSQPAVFSAFSIGWLASNWPGIISPESRRYFRG